MRIQFKILLFLICLNIASGLVIQLALPGTAYFQPTETAGNVTQYEERFNPNATAWGWRATPFSGIPVIGDIFSGFYFFWKQVMFVIDGFPSMLQWISDTYITSQGGKTAFTIISNGLRAVFYVMMSFFVVEFITGRRLPD